MGIETKGQRRNKTRRACGSARWEYHRGCHALCPSPLKLVLFLVLGWLTVGLGGCGVKGPPVPLRQPDPLPAVVDLAHRIDNRQVTLTWRLQSPPDRQAARQARFIVRRFRTALDQPACESCPQVFETVSRMPYVETSDGAYALTLPVEAGFRYAFTVHLETGKLVGADSEPVKFEYPSDDHALPVEEP